MPGRSPASSSSGRSSSARCASRARWQRSALPTRTPTSLRARSERASPPGLRRRAPRSSRGRCSRMQWTRRGSATAMRRRGRRTGAATASFRGASSSGRAAPTDCTTACSIPRVPRAGRSSGLPPEILALLRRTGLCGPAETPRAQALCGGVSSDIWRVDLARGPVCVKRALPRLRVAQLWQAPIERNRYEYEWFRAAGAAAPEAVPRVIARDEGAFVMEYLDPGAYPVWKTLLSEGRAEAGFAAQVARTLARIHAATGALGAAFPTDEIFFAIRLEPYLLATALRHPALKATLQGLVDRTAATKVCLVHGDVSPKNILAGPQGPVFLDAECAWYGDPAFDLAFCLNHLLLKCVWVPQAKSAFLRCFNALSDAYLQTIAFEGVEARAASLLPALLLARVDGKSPVEYLTSDAQKEHVRSVARLLLEEPVSKLSQVETAWQESLT